MVSLGIYSVVPPTEPCALRSAQPLKVSTRDFSWGKGGRYFWLTTYLPCRNVKKIRGLSLPGTPWATSACCGRPLLFYILHYDRLLFSTSWQNEFIVLQGMNGSAGYKIRRRFRVYEFLHKTKLLQRCFAYLIHDQWTRPLLVEFPVSLLSRVLQFPVSLLSRVLQFGHPHFGIFNSFFPRFFIHFGTTVTRHYTHVIYMSFLELLVVSTTLCYHSYCCRCSQFHVFSVLLFPPIRLVGHIVCSWNPRDNLLSNFPTFVRAKYFLLCLTYLNQSLDIIYSQQYHIFFVLLLSK